MNPFDGPATADTITPFDSLLLRQTLSGLGRIPREAASDIYAISFWYTFNEDDKRRPLVIISFNTMRRAEDMALHASDAAEAKWNYAFWLQHAGLIADVGIGKGDREIIGSWIESQGLGWTDEEEERDFERTLGLGSDIESQVIAACVRVAQRLHEGGDVERVVGRSIPIIVHELEYAPDTINATTKANPPELVGEFLSWVRSFGG